MDWANKLRVSCHALGIALLEAKLIDGNRSQEIQLLRVPREEKVDPELPDTLNANERRRKAHLLELGLSDAYVGLCFDALQAGGISIGRLCEALLTSGHRTAQLAALFGRSLHGHLIRRGST